MLHHMAGISNKIYKIVKNKYRIDSAMDNT